MYDKQTDKQMKQKSENPKDIYQFVNSFIAGYG